MGVLEKLTKGLKFMRRTEGYLQSTCEMIIFCNRNKILLQDGGRGTNLLVQTPNFMIGMNGAFFLSLSFNMLDCNILLWLPLLSKPMLIV